MNSEQRDDPSAAASKEKYYWQKRGANWLSCEPSGELLEKIP